MNKCDLQSLDPTVLWRGPQKNKLYCEVLRASWDVADVEAHEKGHVVIISERAGQPFWWWVLERSLEERGSQVVGKGREQETGWSAQSNFDYLEVNLQINEKLSLIGFVFALTILVLVFKVKID